MGGIAGAFYKQFALTIASATVISLLVSLTLSPALAAVILKPHDADAVAHGARRAAARARRSAPTAGSSGSRGGYARFTGARACAAARCSWCCTRVCVVLTAWRVLDTPRGFIPAQDQNNVSISDHDAARHEPRAHGRGRAAGDPDRARHARRVVRVRVRRHGRQQLQPMPRTPARCGPIFDPFEERLPKGQPLTVIAAELRKRLAGITAAEIRVVNPGLRARHGQRRRLPDDDRGPRRARLPRARGRRAAAHGGRARRTRPSRRRSATSTRATRRSTPSSIATRPRCSACRCATCSRRCRPISPAPTSTTSICSATRSR